MSVPLLAFIALGAAAGAGVAAYARFVEPAWLRVRRVVIPVGDALADLDGLRIVHLSDLHIGRSNKRLVRFLRRAASIDADIVVVTGDFVESPDSIPDLGDVLSPVLDGRPVIGILGNHDRFRYPRIWPGARGRAFDASALVDALRGLGVTVLIDGAAIVRTRLGDVSIAGVDIWSHTQRGIAQARGDQAPERTLLLAHSPDILRAAAAEGVPLALVGHTHGGQVRFGRWAPKTATRIPIHPPSGLHRRDGTWMYVSPGLGTTVLPLRFMARPEVAIIELRAGLPH